MEKGGDFAAPASKGRTSSEKGLGSLNRMGCALSWWTWSGLRLSVLLGMIAGVCAFRRDPQASLRHRVAVWGFCFFVFPQSTAVVSPGGFACMARTGFPEAPVAFLILSQMNLKSNLLPVNPSVPGPVVGAQAKR